MNETAWIAFHKAVGHYRQIVEKTLQAAPWLPAAVQKLVDGREGPSYTVETTAVFNRDMDDVTAKSDIKLFLAADNPGRREQAAENRRYLVGPSGKIAEKFFRDNPELGVEFRKNVLILNKTPVHTPRTAELKALCAIGGPEVREAVLDSQRAMAELLLELWTALKTGRPGGRLPVWIIGYSEMKKGGVFEAYTERLKALCAANPEFRDSVLFFRHFSMNQFTIDLKKQARPGEGLEESLARIGAAYRERVLA